MSELSVLLERIVPEHGNDPDWRDVLARRSRQRRGRAFRLTGIAVAALVLVAVPTAWSIGHFRGTPAPPAIRSGILHANDNEITQALGVMTRQPGVDASKTHGVMVLATPAGPVRLWSAPVQGGGHCSFLQIGESHGSGRPRGTTACEVGAPPPGAPIVFGMDASADFSGQRLVHGWVHRELRGKAWRPTKLTLTYSDGSKADLRLVEGYFMTLVPRQKRAETLTLYARNGANLGAVSVDDTPPSISHAPAPHTERGTKLIDLTLENGSVAHLYATPGKVDCYVVEVVSPTGSATSGGSCGGGSGAVDFGLQGFGGGPGPPEGVLLQGYARSDVARVELRLASGRALQLPIEQGYVLVELPHGDPPKMLVSFDSAGHELERQQVVP